MSLMSECKHEFKNKLISHGIPWKCNFYIDICEKCRKTKREIFIAEKLEESRKENTELLKKVEWLQVREAELVGALKDWLSIHGSGFCAIGTCYKCGESMPSISHAMCESCAIEQAKKALADWRDKQNV